MTLRNHPAREGLAPPIPDYRLIRVLGEGSYGRVWLARGATGTFRAIKVVERADADSGHAFAQAFRGLRYFEPISRQDDSLMDILHVGPGEPEGYFYCVMELADPAPRGLDGANGQPTTAADPGSVPPSSPGGLANRSDGIAVEARPAPTPWDPVEPVVIEPDTYTPFTLRLLLERRRRLPVSECVDLGIALCRALGGLHGHNLVHRDVKPSNIIFARGRPKLADIDLVIPPDTTRSRVQVTGYTPPDGDGTPAADLYSLGKVLYEASTGLSRTQFPAPPLDLPEAEGSMWADLNDVLLRACSRVPGERYAWAREMHDDLLLVRAGKSVGRWRSLERWRRRAIRWGTVALGAALLATGGFLRERHHARRWQAAAAESREHLVQLHTSNARRAMDDGLPHLASLWLAQALESAADPDTIYRLRWRIGALGAISPGLAAMGLHTDAINEVAFSPDGRRFVTASEDGTAQVVDATSGHRVGAILRHAGAIQDVRFSPEGHRILTASLDGTVGVWDAATGEAALPPLDHGTPVVCLAVGADGRRIAGTGEDWRTRVWDAASGRRLFLTPPHGARVWWIEFSPDGRWLVTAGEDHRAVMTRVADGTQPYRPIGHPDQVRYATFSPDSRRLLTAGRDGVARFWNVETGEAEGLEIRHLRLNYAAFDHAGRRVVTATGAKGEPSEVRIWDAFSGQPIGLPLRHDSRVRYAVFSPDDRWLATASHDGIAQVVRVGSNGEGVNLTHGGHVWALAFHPDGSRLLTGGREPVWRLWDLRQHGPTPMTFPVDQIHVLRLGSRSDGSRVWAGNQYGGGLWQLDEHGQPAGPSLLPDRWEPLGMDAMGRRLALRSPSGALHVWDLDTFESIGPACPHPEPVSATALHPSGAMIAVGDYAGIVRIWNGESGTLLAEPLAMPVPYVGHLAFSADGRRLGICTGGYAARPGSFTLLDTTTFQVVGGIRVHEDVVTHCAFAPDDALVAVAIGTFTGTLPASVYFVETSSGRDVLEPIAHPDGVFRMAFDPEGRLLATADEEGTIRIWSMPDRAPFGPARRSQKGHAGIAFHPDGRHIAAVSMDGSLDLWELATGEQLIAFSRQAAPFSAVRFLGQGERMVTASSDGEVRIWNLPVAREPVGELRARAELNAGMALTPDGLLLGLSPQELQTRWQRLRGPGTGP